MKPQGYFSGWPEYIHTSADCGTEWKPICWQFGISRPTAHRRWEYGLSVIVWRLNGRRVPTKRSRRYVVEGARGDQPLRSNAANQSRRT